MSTKRVTFGGESYMVPAGANPRSIADAQRMERALKAAEKPKEGPSKSSATPTPKKSSRASSTPSSGSERARGVPPSGKIEVSTLPRRMSRMDEARETARGRRVARDAMDAIGASAKPTQENTRRLPTGESKSSEGGRVRYKGNERLYADAEKANSLQLDIRQGKYNRGEKNNRNAAAIREKARRGLK